MPSLFPLRQFNFKGNASRHLCKNLEKGAKNRTSRANQRNVCRIANSLTDAAFTLSQLMRSAPSETQKQTDAALI